MLKSTLASSDRSQMEMFGGADELLAPTARAALLDSARQWLAVADDMDLVQHALRLTDLVTSLDPDWEQAVLVRVRLLLLAGRPDEAALLLSSDGQAGFDPSAPAGLESCLRAAVFASLGDDQAYRYVQGVLREASEGGRAPWLITYLMATTAALRGDDAIADQMWVDLVGQQGIVTRLTLPRFVAARIAARAGNGWERARLIRRSARYFEDLAQPVAADPAPVLDAADRLRGRGDTAGAALLLYAVARRQSESKSVVGMLESLVTTAGGSRRLPTRRPDSQRADLSAHRWIRVINIPEAKISAFAELSIGAIFAAFLGGAIAAIVTTAIPALQDYSLTLGLVWLLGLVAFPALAVVGILDLHLRYPARLQPKPGKGRAKRRDVPQCECLLNRARAGAAAVDYLELHLVPAADAATVAPVGRADLGPHVTVSRCPNTSILWLGLDVVTGHPAYLFRGVAPVAQAPAGSAPGMYL